jgi:hypothetical protein
MIKPSGPVSNYLPLARADDRCSVAARARDTQ